MFLNLKGNTLDKSTGSFTKQNTQIAKGIAILLMVYHHLFVIPERLNFSYFAIPNVFGFEIQSVIANFCKICVCIFAFLSGIGLYYSLSKEKSIFDMYKKVGLKALGFMVNFWVIAIIVYPLGLLFGFFTFDVDCLLKVILADYSAVMEWWFVRQYIVLLVLAPIFVNLFQNTQIYFKILPVVIIAVFWLIIKIFTKYGLIDIDSVFYSYFLCFERVSCILTFFVGIISARFNLYSVYLKFQYKRIISILSITVSVIFRIIFSNNPTSMYVDFILVPLFVFGTTTLIINTNLSKIFEYFAKHSTNIWLTHTFWCYYFFQDIVFKPYYSILIYIWTLILSLLSSYLINIIYIPINNFLFTKEHKFRYKNFFFFNFVKS